MSAHEVFPSAKPPCEPYSVTLQRTDAEAVFWSSQDSVSDVSQILERASEIVPSIPARLAYFCLKSGAFCRNRAFCSCIGYLGYPFQYMCSYDKLYPCLFLSIHITSKVFHIALSPRIFERISQVANTGADRGRGRDPAQRDGQCDPASRQWNTHRGWLWKASLVVSVPRRA